MTKLKDRSHLSPYDRVAWKRIDSQIVAPDGSVLYSLKGVEAPEGWSQNAIDVAVNKYLRKAGIDKSQISEGRETSIRQMVSRVLTHLEQVAEADGYFSSTGEASQVFDKLVYLLLTQRASFNSPVWFNCGLGPAYGVKAKAESYYMEVKSNEIVPTENIYARPQTSACFIQSVSDSLVDIFDLVKKESRIFKYGSGTGTNFSPVRGKQELLDGGGESSGLMSFLEVLDKGAGATKSGGVTRRAAKMVCLDLDHPEIFDFVNWKAKEEKKAKALIAAGFESGFEGEVYKSISGQNSNNSVRITDQFFEAIDKDDDWQTLSRTDGSVLETFPARKLWEELVSAAWECADPGVQFTDTIEAWNPCKTSGRINASNPCSEYMFLDESACNLASINLVPFLNDNSEFEYEEFSSACKTLFQAQDILVNLSSYPTEVIARNSFDFRPIGLGYSNLGGLLMRMGSPYGGESSVQITQMITSEMHLSAIEASADLAERLGPFAHWNKNKAEFTKVLQMHFAAVKEASEQAPEGSRWERQLERWLAVLQKIDKFGVRNSQFTLIAPTGTIGLLMDCDTLGIEPEFSLVKTKTLAGGGQLKIVNQSVEPALKKLGLATDKIGRAMSYLEQRGTLQDCQELSPEQQAIFLTAVPAQKGEAILTWENHLNIMQAAQPFLSGAISKTINLSEATNKETIGEIYRSAWSRGLKSLAIYREGSKGSQPLNVADIDAQIEKPRVYTQSD